MNPFDLLPHSCSKCQDIVIDGTGPDVDWCLEFPYHEVKHLSQYCDFFSWTLNFPTTPLCNTFKLELYISTMNSENLPWLNVEWKDENDEGVSRFVTKRDLHIFSRGDDNAARYIESRPLEPSPARSVHSECCLELYKDCLNNETCKIVIERRKKNTAPTRLLDIRSNSKLRLYTVPHEESPLYAALSYCWGSSQQQQDAKTKKANVQDRHRRIDILQLPQSIRDAIEVTQSLELSYLWVDALCIVQDDPTDCTSELSKMASIYQGAAITISAASANDSTEGFLKDRDLKKEYGKLFQLPYHNNGADGVVKGLVLLSEHPITDTRQENIDKRAWTMQEDMLSPRLLRFGSKQTTWRCPNYPESKEIDGGGCPIVVNKDYNFSVDDPYLNAEVQENILDLDLPDKLWVERKWHERIEEYTLRNLTKSSDRLPACAALAENFADIRGFKSSEYLAGLWKENIHAHLLWYRQEGSKAERISSPTWSWASINGPISFLDDMELKPEPDANIAEYVDSSMSYKFDNHKYSEVMQGRLELNGRLKYVYWDSRFLRRSSDGADVLPLRIYWDVTDGDRLGKSEAQTMGIFEVFGSSTCSSGLVLVREEQTRFKRVGYFECTKFDSEEGSVEAMNSFFDETQPQTIAIY